MKGKHRKRGHHRGATLTGITLVAAASIIIVSVTVARDTTPKSPDVAAFKWAVPSLPPKTIILQDEPHGAPASDCSVLPPQERGEAGREPAFRDSVKADTATVANGAPVPAPATGFTDDLSSAAHSYMAQNALHLQYTAQRNAIIARIDGYLHNFGSPMEGLGRTIVEECAPYNVSPTLVTAIAVGESQAGKQMFASYNYWGGLAYPGGFGSWQESIRTHVEWLHRYFGSPQTAYDCPGYCIPDQPWMDNVDGVRRSI